MLFTIVLAFFFDERYVGIASVCFLTSEFVSWFVKGGHLLPPNDELFNANEERAVAVAECIRKDIAKDPVNYRDEAQVSVTVTMGVSSYRDGMSIQAMMDDADAKLYWGKKNGKNQVVNVLPDDPSKPKKKATHTGVSGYIHTVQGGDCTPK